MAIGYLTVRLNAPIEWETGQMRERVRCLAEKWLAPAVTVLLVVGMTGAAEGLEEPEILFPEITALAIGAWLAPLMVWRTSRTRLFVLITASAMLGVLIVRCCPLPLFWQLCLAFLLSQLLLTASGTSFAPMTSALVLPVLLGTTSWVYPLSAAVMTAAIVGVQRLLEAVGLCESAVFVPRPFSLRETFGMSSPLYKRLLTATALLLLATASGWRFCAAPPLLVAFIELSNPACPARSRPLKTVTVVALCTLAGSLVRYVLCVRSGLPLTLAAMLIALGLVLFVRFSGFYFPPAGAMAVLTLLVPETALTLLPLQALLGMALLTAAALTVFRPVAAAAVTDARME